MIGGLLVTILIALYVHRAVGSADGDTIKPDLYYFSSSSAKNETSGNKMTVYLHAMLPNSKNSSKVSDSITDVYSGLPSSQWDVRKKPKSSYFSITPKANKVNTITKWGGANEEPESGYKFTSLGNSNYLVERFNKNDKTSEFYVKHNGIRRMVTLDKSKNAIKSKNSPFIWKLTPVLRVHTTEAPSTTTASSSTPAQS